MEKANQKKTAEQLKAEIETLEKKLIELQEKAQTAQELQKDSYIQLIKKLEQSNDKKSKDKLFAAIYLLLIFICIFFAIAFEVYSSHDLRKRQNEMITAIEDSHNRINLLSSYISVLDNNMQIIPDILKKNFGQINSFANNQVKEFKKISTKSMESLDKVKNIDQNSKNIVQDINEISRSAIKSIEKFESLEHNTKESIKKIETIENDAIKNREKVVTLINEEHQEKIITYLKKYKNSFNNYKSKNDLSLVYKMVIIDEIGSVPYNTIIEALKKYKFRNYSPPDIATLKEWDQNMIDLCRNAITYLEQKDIEEQIKYKDRYFDRFKAKNDYSNYKKWGYFEETLNYPDLITFYQNTLTSVKNRVDFNRKIKNKPSN